MRDRAARLPLFFGTAALLFAASGWATLQWCGPMAGGMPMPGRWTMSMAWMRMGGQTWLGSAASFTGMWAVMMAAMMLPSLATTLWGYSRSLAGLGAAQPDRLATLAGAAYFAVWVGVGAAVYPLGIALAEAEMQWPQLARLVPIATGAAVLLAGAAQLTAWKARHLGRCRSGLACGMAAGPEARSAWRHGARLGVHCTLCCAPHLVVLRGARIAFPRTSRAQPQSVPAVVLTEPGARGAGSPQR